MIGQESILNLAQAFLLSEDVRLLTLVGPPGIGKTRLGLQISREGASPFKDGVFFVELGPISDPSLVASSIATTLGLRETGDYSILDVLRRFLAEKKMLLLLDNFEQVLDAAPL